MAIAIVSGPTVRQNGPSLSQVFSVSTTGSGDRLLVAVLSSYATTVGTTGITDNGGNTWVKAVNSSHASLQQRVEIWYAITSGSITSLTVTEGASHAVSLIFYEISGANLVNPIRATGNGNDTTSDTTWAVGTYNRTEGGEILLLHGASSPNITLTTVTPPLNYTTGGIAGGGATTQAGCTVHRIHTTTTGTYGGNATTNLASTNGWAYVIINSRLDATASMPTANVSTDTVVSSTGTGGAEPQMPAIPYTLAWIPGTPSSFAESLSSLATAMASVGSAAIAGTGGATATPPSNASWVTGANAPTVVADVIAMLSPAVSALGAFVNMAWGGATVTPPLVPATSVLSPGSIAMTFIFAMASPSMVTVAGQPITVAFDTLVIVPGSRVDMGAPSGMTGMHWWFRQFGTLERTTQDTGRVEADRHVAIMPVMALREERAS